MAMAFTAAGVAGGAAVSHALTRFLVKVAVDRNFPTSAATIARAAIRGSSCDEAFLQRLQAASQELAHRPHEIRTLQAQDGTLLTGHYFGCDAPRRLVLAMHGWRSSWSNDFGLIAPFLLENRCAVLFAEQRGQGSSGGAYMGLGALERYDCVCWAKALAEEFPKLPLYLAGISMGAATVLMSTAFTLPETVKGIIADCGFTTPNAICHHVARNNLHVSYGLRAFTADKLCKRKNAEGLRGCSAPQALAESSIPVLFVHGTDDSFVPVEMTFENYKACAAPKHLFLVPGADHGMSYYLDKEGYEQALLHFWALYD